MDSLDFTALVIFGASGAMSWIGAVMLTLWKFDKRITRLEYMNEN